MGVEPNAKDAELAWLCGVLERVSEQHRYTLTLKQLTVLLICYLSDQDRTLRTIAVRLGSAKPAVSRMLEHLIEYGLIERLADPRDRRSVLFQYTPAGQKFLRGIVAEYGGEQ
jgi:DNA-binding MarR family transcriptional regulator